MPKEELGYVGKIAAIETIIEKYHEGLKQYPHEAHLKTNLAMVEIERVLDMPAERPDKYSQNLLDYGRDIEAARKLCEIYFDIAAEIIGPEAVRARRDEILKDSN